MALKLLTIRSCAGRYHLEAAYSDDRAAHPKADGRRLQYMGTFEVLPL